MKVCICGGGNIGHVIAGFVSAHKQHEVCILTQHSKQWSRDIVIEAPEGKVFAGHLNSVSCDVRKMVSDADIVLLCLPGYAIRQTLLQVRDYLPSHTAVGSVVSSTGFFFEALDVLPANQPMRVPFISRIVEYGHSARLMGYKDSLSMAVEHAEHPEVLRDVMAEMLQTPIQLLNSFYEASLSNSNPLLHPSRLYSLWKDWKEGELFSRVPLFYEEWTEEAARLYIQMDDELQALLERLPVRKGSIATVLDYYESVDAHTLSQKLRSIEAFKGILAPVKEVEGGYVPDFQSRYFTEDFPYGLQIVQRLAHQYGVDSPVIDIVLQWGLSHLA